MQEEDTELKDANMLPEKETEWMDDRHLDNIFYSAN